MELQKLIFSDNEISKIVSNLFDLRPYFIEQRLKLRNPIYQETSAYGHMGRKPEIVKKKFVSSSGELIQEFEVELYYLGKIRLC
jgi:S-adenosylmethionine synthetase